MVGDVENLKVKVNNESESKEVQELFFELGFGWCCGDIKKTRNTSASYIYCYKISKDMTFGNNGESFYNHENKEITLQYLRTLVVLKRNSIDYATHYYGGSKYYLTDSEFYQYSENKWVNIDQYVDGMTFKKIEKGCEVKKKEYIANVSGDWRFVESHELVSGRIEVPEEAEIFLLDKSFGEDTLYFVKHDGEVFHEYYTNATDVSNNAWIKGTIKVLHDGMGKVLWQRNHTITPNTSIQEKLKSIKRNGEVKMKEYLDTNYELRSVKQTSGDNRVPSGWIEVPEGAEEYRANCKFYKNNGELFYSSLLFEWTKSSMPEYITLWQRNPETPNTSIQDKLKFIEKWLNGEKIQYILGVESEKTQWHNFTEGAMQYIKRSDIKFREAPKYVTINGVEFKSVESLLKYVKNNFDLEDGE